MFTGIIEQMGQVKSIAKELQNVHFTIHSKVTSQLKIDQSVSHNGVCLTVVAIEGDEYVVTAIAETLLLTNLGDWKVGDFINLERAAVQHSRLDGHIVQGHIDIIGSVAEISEAGGSWYYKINYPRKFAHLLVNKGSICINGVSLTVVNPDEHTFSVAIIPYTYENTVFQHFQLGTVVNLEFDIIGKYIARYASVYMPDK
jgi:riboflavin synthase